MKLRMTLAVAALLTAGLSSAAAYADTITFTLTNPTGYVGHTEYAARMRAACCIGPRKKQPLGRVEENLFPLTTRDSALILSHARSKTVMPGQNPARHERQISGYRKEAR